MNRILIANRDPDEKDIVLHPFWLNMQSKELFHFDGKWISLSELFLQIKECKISKPLPDEMNNCPPTTAISDGFFPPPWNPNEFPEKTRGWCEFQKAMRKDPEYYLTEAK
jgi:hypothetical protein